MLGTGLTTDWSNLPIKPLFLPLFARLTFHLAGVEAERPASIAGVPIMVPLGGAYRKIGGCGSRASIGRSRPPEDSRPARRSVTRRRTSPVFTCFDDWAEPCRNKPRSP